MNGPHGTPASDPPRDGNPARCSRVGCGGLGTWRHRETGARLCESHRGNRRQCRNSVHDPGALAPGDVRAFLEAFA